MKNIIMVFCLNLFLFNLYSNDSLKIRPIEIEFGINHLTNYTEISGKIGFGASVKKIWLSERK